MIIINFEYNYIPIYIFFYFRHYCVKQSITDEHLYLLTDARVEALDRSLSQLNLFDKSNTDAVWKFVSDIQKDPTTTVLTTFSKIADKLIFRYFKIICKLYVQYILQSVKSFG